MSALFGVALKKICQATKIIAFIILPFRHIAIVLDGDVDRATNEEVDTTHIKSRSPLPKHICAAHSALNVI